MDDFTSMITEALDEVMPMKTFTVKLKYKFGLSENIKTIMAKRDSTRLSIKNASHENKKTLLYNTIIVPYFTKFVHFKPI